MWFGFGRLHVDWLSAASRTRRQEGPVLNELTYQQIIGGISGLVAVLTPDGAVQSVNQQVLDYFGKTLEELKEWASTDAVHPEDLL